MIKKYLLTALRTLRRNKLFSLINVLGLSIGISAALVIYLIVHYEFSFEQFQPDKDRIYRVVTATEFGGNVLDNSGIPYPIPDAIRREVAGIRECTALCIAYPTVTIPTPGTNNRGAANTTKQPVFAGRSPQPSDTMRELVINETCRRLLGFKEPAEAIGKSIGDNPKLPIVGVVADFHHASLHTPIKPLALSSAKNNEFSVLIALRPQTPGSTGWSTTLAQVGRLYKDFFPEGDYSYAFYDESIAQFYTREQNIARLLTWATGLTLFISCLGLAGLVIFTTNNRTKEIGVRKVLGASVAAIAALLSKDFVKLLVIAFFIATPIAWWALNKWLESFAYQAPVSWWIFPLAGIGMMVIALLTISVRTIRSAMANPVKALRSE